MTKIQTKPWDVAEHLETDEDMAAYLEAALEEGDPGLVAAALGDIARARGMAQIAQETGLGRESLYKALSPEGNPEFATVLKVVRALGLRLRATTSRPRFCIISPYPVAARGRSRGQRSVVGRQMIRLGILTWIDSEGGMRFAFPPYGPTGPFLPCSCWRNPGFTDRDAPGR